MSRARLPVTSPSTGRLLTELPACLPQELPERVARARRAQRDWAATPVATRAERLGLWRTRLASDGETLVRLLASDNGKPTREAQLHELLPLLDALDWLVQQGPELLANEQPDARWLKHRRHVIEHRARGVVGLLTPFNFPLLIAIYDAAAALLAGSAVVVKPSQHAPLVLERAAELAREAGLPPDVFQVIFGDSELGAAFPSAGFDELLFTGSQRVGRLLARAAAETLTPLTLELGGNSALVALPDCDVTRTAEAILFGGFANSGQSCFGVARVYVARSRQAELLEALRERIARLTVGDPEHGSHDLGALTTAAQVERCEQAVAAAKAAGHRILVGGTRLPGPGNFFFPTLVDCDDPLHPVVTDELFGPVVTCVPYDDEANALSWVNDSPFGLAGYVFGRELERAASFADQLELAHVLVDDVLSSYVCPELPLAPRRASGLGVVHGAAGLLARTTPRVLGYSRLSLPTSVQFGGPRNARLLEPVAELLTRFQTFRRSKAPRSSSTKE